MKFNLKQFAIISLITGIWINISEIWRYFVIVRPKIKAYWNNLDGIVEMDVLIFSIWGIWMIILAGTTVFFFWLYAEKFGNSIKSVFGAGTLIWMLFFVLFWIGTANMGFSNWGILLITLPLSWFELIIACWLASMLYKNYDN